MKNTGTTGTNAVDWEARVDYDRLRSERLARRKPQLDRSDMGAVLAFDFSRGHPVHDERRTSARGRWTS